MPEACPHFVSIVIPHYNDFDNLVRCVACLRRQSFPPDSFEIIVADNNSPGGTAAVERRAPGIRVVPAPEQGAGPARNAGAAAARGDVLAFIDADCFADQEWLAQGLAALARYDYVGGRVRTRISANSRLTPAEAYEAVFAFDFKKYIQREGYSGAGNLFVPKAVFEAVGGFRNHVPEDIDWCRRANAMGYRLGYAEAAVVEHRARRDWAELAAKHERMQRETLCLWREQPRWRSRWLLHAVLVAASPLAHWVRVLRSPRLIGLRAKLQGVFGLLMIRSYRSYRMLRLLREPLPTGTGGNAR